MGTFFCTCMNKQTVFDSTFFHNSPTFGNTFSFFVFTTFSTLCSFHIQTNTLFFCKKDDISDNLLIRTLHRFFYTVLLYLHLQLLGFFCFRSILFQFCTMFPFSPYYPFHTEQYNHVFEFVKVGQV